MPRPKIILSPAGPRQGKYFGMNACFFPLMDASHQAMRSAKSRGTIETGPCQTNPTTCGSRTEAPDPSPERRFDLLVRRFSKATYPIAAEPWPEGDQ